MDELNRIRLSIPGVEMDADVVAVSKLIGSLVEDAEFRQKFASDPQTVLREHGINVSDEVAARITPESIDETLASLSDDDRHKLLPAVGVAVEVGTSPGTNPGTAPMVIVATEVATRTSTFAVAEEGDAD